MADIRPVTTPTPGQLREIIGEEIIASKEFENTGEKYDLQFPIEDVNDYGGSIIFSTIIEEDADIPGLFAGLGDAVSTIASRREKFDERGEPLPKSAKEAQKRAKEYREAAEQLNNFRTDTKKTKRDERRYERSVSLYLPTGLQFADKVDYENVDLGVTGGAVASGLAGGQGAIQSAAKSMVDGVGSFIEGFSTAANSDLARLAAVRTASKFGDETGNAVKSFARVTLNPNTRTLFKSVGIRSFSFSFKMIAESEREAREIREIIKFFRTELYPQKITLGENGDQSENFSLGYRFPNKFQIEMFYNDVPVATKILPCFLDSFTTTYNGTSMSMHRDGSFEEVDITMSFTEARTLSRKDIEEGGY